MSKQEPKPMEDLEEILASSTSAMALLESLASAVLPPTHRDREHLTWPDRDGRDDGEALLSAEERLRAAEARYRALVEQIPAVTFMAVLGEGENEVYVSPHVEALLGYTQEEWLEDPFLWYWRLHPDDRKLWNEEFARGCRTGGPFRADCRFLARDGSEVWVHGEARIINDERGRPQVLQGVAFDITEMKRAEALAVQQAKITEELEIAHRMQTSILPVEPAAENLVVHGFMEPADDVGGDYYDIIPFDGGCWIAIGDVSGHGLNAGLMMMMTQSAMAGIAATGAASSPRRVLGQLNRVMFTNIRARLGYSDYLTMCMLRYTADGQVVYAGQHLDLIVRRAATGDVMRFPTQGTWLGITPDLEPLLIESILHLEPGDILVLYTDGITEARHRESGEMFGLGRLCQVVEEAGDARPEKVVRAVIDSVDAWSSELDDDRTVVATRYEPPNQGEPS